MPSPFPGMDPFVEQAPLFHELHTLMMTTAQGLLLPQLRPRYVARLEPGIPNADYDKELDQDELQQWRQRHIVIYTAAQPRKAVASLEFLRPSNKEPCSMGQARYLEKRAAAMRDGLYLDQDRLVACRSATAHGCAGSRGDRLPGIRRTGD